MKQKIASPVSEEDAEIMSDSSSVVLEVDKNQKLNRRMTALVQSSNDEDLIDSEEFKKLEARVNFFEEMLRNEK